MALYEPNKSALLAIKDHLMPGSILMMDELNNSDYPGETKAFKEVFKGDNFELVKSKYMTDRTFVILK